LDAAKNYAGIFAHHLPSRLNRYCTKIFPLYQTGVLFRAISMPTSPSLKNPFNSALNEFEDLFSG
jgi:hypothetical protein